MGGGKDWGGGLFSASCFSVRCTCTAKVNTGRQLKAKRGEAESFKAVGRSCRKIGASTELRMGACKRGGWAFL